MEKRTTTQTENQVHRQYEALRFVPLIKSPSLRIPRPIELPHDIHPLPHDIEEYFRYPFTLEPHVLTMESSRQVTIAAHANRREAYLRSREEAKKRRKKEALHRVAPGFEPEKGVLTPTSLHTKPANRSDVPIDDHEEDQKYLDQLASQLSNLNPH